MNKKTKLELAICHILQTKDWALSYELVTELPIPISGRFISWINEKQATFIVFEGVKNDFIGFGLTEEELITYFDQKKEDFKNV